MVGCWYVLASSSAVAQSILTDVPATLPGGEAESRHAEAAFQLSLPQPQFAATASIAGEFTANSSADLLADEPATLEARVKALEAMLKKDADAAAKKKADDSLKPTQRWTGRIHADYWAF